ncbi:MAG: hypothetical protein JJU41_00645 [Bacteroidetes bacterium]|nr:hypothetical protein [Bacteroidota bacterium]MCH8523774.1 hypothetical protein [Balneolales bacterium]
MKTSKNTLVAATLTIAIALGCANFIDLSTSTNSIPSIDQDTAKIQIESTLAWGIREDIVIIKPD